MISIDMDIQDNMNYIDIDDYLCFYYKDLAKKKQLIRLKIISDKHTGTEIDNTIYTLD
jgi:hypothetical protein